MTQVQQQTAAKDFANFWKDKGDEKQESQQFWIDLLQNVFGVENPAKYIEFEKKVRLNHTSYIDAYIASTKVLIEQKGLKIDLHKAYEQSDGQMLTPFQQAKRYVNEMKASEKPRWIVVCNFAEFLVYDLEEPAAEPEQILLEDLEKDFYRLQFLVDLKNENIRREEEISIKAGILVGKLYDAIFPEYKNPDEKSFRSLNILCVRIVFCLYAEDAGLFATRTSFEDYIKSFNLQNLRVGMINLFKALDTKLEDRDKYDESLKPFPYVNGGLFKDENIEIPNFTQNIVDVIINHCAPFNWSEISPTIFGAVFESTLNPDTRRKGGMHYTSIQNIHKVIDPLFMDDLNEEFEQISHINSVKTRNDKLIAFQEKLGSLKFLDPACGSGNFLTETYLSLRRLENKIISLLNKGDKALGFEEFINVKINQFYGIEINDFAVTVAKTALWIAESQMIIETEAILSQTIDFLPLSNHANIIEGNALRIDWGTLSEEPQEGLLFADKLNVYKIPGDLENLELHSPALEYGKHYKELNVVTKEVEEKELPKSKKKEPVVYDYIIGNPPFSGARVMHKESDQKKDIADIFPDIKGAGNLDYVCCWYKRASEFIKGKPTKAALVSTNSICQGEHVSILWKLIFSMGIQIDFAYRTFKWYSESSDMAHVHCVIIGFSSKDSEQKQKFVFDENGTKILTKNINGYLLDLPNVCIESRQHPLCDVPEIGIGNKPIDGGFYLFAESEMRAFIKKEPESEQYFHEWMGSDEFIKGNKRWCLYLGEVSPAKLLKMPECMKRVQAVRDYRLKSSSAPTIKLAEKPTHFHVENFPKSNYLLIPRVSSGKRKYVPIGFLTPDIFSSDSVHIIPNANLFHFGILTSVIHNIWLRTTGGRLKSDYRYSKDVVYNNFPWCSPSESQKAKIESTAQAILDARKKYSDCTLSQLYGDTAYLFPELVKAHEENDKAVMQAYGFSTKMSESEIVADLFKMYEKLNAHE